MVKDITSTLGGFNLLSMCLESRPLVVYQSLPCAGLSNENATPVNVSPTRRLLLHDGAYHAMSAPCQYVSSCKNLDIMFSRYDIDAFPSCFSLDICAQLCSSFLNGRRGRYRSRDDFYPVPSHRFGDSSPVMNARQARPSDMQLIKTKQAVSQHDRVLRGLCLN